MRNEPRPGKKLLVLDIDFRWDKIDYPDTDQWGSFKAQQKLHFKAFFHAVH